MAQTELVSNQEYEFVLRKEPFNWRVSGKSAIKWLFADPARFIWNMGTYHVLILMVTIGLGVEVPANVILKLGMGDVSAVANEMQAVQTLQHSITNILFLMIILFLDFGLLTVLKYEFKSLRLTFTKIFILELIIFSVGIVNPYVRTGLFFFSANTLWIATAYRWFIKRWVLFQYFFLNGSYILILKLVVYALWALLTGSYIPR